MGVRSEVGVALRIDTLGTVPATFRIADACTIDNATGEQYAPDLIDLSDLSSSIPGPTTPIATNSAANIKAANRGGQFYEAITDGVVFDSARVRAWLTVDQEFSSGDDPFWAGELDELAIDIDDDALSTTARGPLKALEGIRFPSRLIEATTYPNAPASSQGKLLPVRFGLWTNGNRFSEMLCTNALTGEVTLLDTKAADGTWIPVAAVNAVPSGGNEWRDSLLWLVERSKYDPRNPRGMLAHGPGAPRRSVAFVDTTNQDESRGKLRIGNRVTVADPPEDTPDPVEQVDPCATVTETPTSDPEVVEQCPASNPDTPKDSWGGERATDFDPANDVVLGKHGGYVGKNPDGVGFHNNVSSFGAQVWTILRRFIGLLASKLYEPSMFSAEEWPGSGEQAELSLKNAPQLEEQYDLAAVLAAGAWENGALFYERAGKIALAKSTLLGSGSAVAFEIKPNHVKAGSLRIVRGRFGDYANAVTFVSFGHGIAPDLLPYASAYRENADAIAEKGRLVPYYVGQEFSRRFGLWLDGKYDSQIGARAGEMLSLLSSRHQLIELELVPTLDIRAAVMALRLGQVVSLVWPAFDDSLGAPRSSQPLIPEDEPALCPIIGLAPDPIEHTLKLRVLRFLSAGGSDAGTCVYLRVAPETATFPASLGGGDATTYDEGWSAEQKDYWMCTWGGTGRSKTAPA